MLNIINILLFGAIFAVIIVLQIKLSKKEAVMPGLIIPIISFVLSIIITVASCLLTFNVFTEAGETEVYYEDEVVVSYTDDAEYIEEDIEEVIEYEKNEEEGYGLGLAFIPVVIFANLPTMLYLALYFIFHPTKKRLAKKAELDKMSISDL